MATIGDKLGRGGTTLVTFPSLLSPKELYTLRTFLDGKEVQGELEASTW